MLLNVSKAAQKIQKYKNTKYQNISNKTYIFAKFSMQNKRLNM